jgi:modification methylase
LTDSPPIRDQIFHGDALDILPTLPANSVDLVFADPPYNLQLEQDLWRPNLTMVDAVDEAWDQFEGFESYDQFTTTWLEAARRVMKDTASIWVSGTYHNIFRVGAILQDLGFWILNTVTWSKPNATPNFRGTRLKNDVEIVIWAKPAKNGGYTFNHHDMKQFNDGKQLGSVWEIPVCGGRERLRDANGNKLHPTQKPEELLKRILLASSTPGNVVLDPFLGTGTTAAVAKRLHRHWIGIDSHKPYVQAARARVAAVRPLKPSDPLLRASSLHKPPRVPFKNLLERGYLRPGQTLYLTRSDYTAVILKDGTLRAGDHEGTIHRLGAQLKNVPSCNGWTQWQYIDQETGQYRPIDNLRQKVRQILAKENKR